MKVKKKRGYVGKLSMEKANEIRQKYFEGNITQQQLANDYGVHKSTVGAIINNILYKVSND